MNGDIDLFSDSFVSLICANLNLPETVVFFDNVSDKNLHIFIEKYGAMGELFAMIFENKDTNMFAMSILLRFLSHSILHHNDSKRKCVAQISLFKPYISKHKAFLETGFMEGSDYLDGLMRMSSRHDAPEFIDTDLVELVDTLATETRMPTIVVKATVKCICVTLLMNPRQFVESGAVSMFPKILRLSLQKGYYQITYSG